MICQFEIMFLVKFSRYAPFYVVILVGNCILIAELGMILTSQKR